MMPGMGLRRRQHRLVFAVVAFVLAWLLAEIVLGITGWYKTPSERVYTDIYDAAYELLPNAPLRFGNSSIPSDPTNHAGFRGPEFRDEKAPGEYRVISIGDSTTFGVMVPESETYTRIIETLLRQKFGPRVQALNAGVPGTNVYTHRLLFAKKLVHFHPDAAVVYLLFNSRAEIEIWRELERRATRGEADTVNVVHQWLHHSKVYRLLRRMIKGGERSEVVSHIEAIRQTMARRDPDEMRWVKAGLQEDLNGLFTQAEQNHVRLLIVHHLHRALVRECVARLANPELEPSNMASSLEEYMRFSRQICDMRGVAFINPTEPFVAATAAGQELFLDNEHFSPAGHRLMGELIARYMVEHADYFGLAAGR